MVPSEITLRLLVAQVSPEIYPSIRAGIPPKISSESSPKKFGPLPRNPLDIPSMILLQISDEIAIKNRSINSLEESSRSFTEDLFRIFFREDLQKFNQGFHLTFLTVLEIPQKYP